ncbi:MAG: MFS transporter [Pseudomonadota bacterium]
MNPPSPSAFAVPNDSPARKLLPLAAIVLLGSLAIGLPLGALPLYLHGVLGFDTVTVGWVVGIQSLATLLTRQLAGNYCDRHGPKFSALVGLPLAVFAGFIYLVSMWMPAGAATLGVLVVGRLLMGLAESLFLTGTMTWGIARLGPNRTGMVMAWQGIALFSAFGLGSPMGIAMMQYWGFTGVSIATMLFPLMALAIAIAVPAVARMGASRAKESMLAVVGLVWRPGLAMALGTMPFSVITTFLVLYYGEKGWAGAGLSVASFTAGYIAVRLFLAHLPDKMGGRKVGMLSVMIQIAALLLLCWAPSPALALVACVAIGIGLSLVFPAMGVEAMRHVTPERRGLAIGCFVAFIDLSTAMAGPLMGAVIGLGGYPAVFLSSAVCCVIALGLMGWGLGGRKAT